MSFERIHKEDIAPVVRMTLRASFGDRLSASPAWQLGLVALLVPLIVYLVTLPGNHSEAEDAFWYARVAEDPEASWVHLHHMLYFPTIKLFNDVVVFFGHSGHAYGALVVAHTFIGALTVFLFQIFLHRRLKVELASSIIGALLLAFSYGFWRYSAEVEIPAWTALTSLLLLYLGFSDRFTLPQALGLGLVAAIAILFHGLNALLACTIIPLRLLNRFGIWYPIAYAAGAAVVLFSVYSTAMTVGESSSITSPVDPSKMIDPVYLLKGLIGLGQAFVSGNFVWGNSWVAEQLVALFASQNMREESFMGAQAPAWLFYASLLTISALCVSCLHLVTLRLKLPIGRTMTSDVGYILFWCVMYLAFVVCFKGGNPELATPALVPVWALVTVFVIDALCRNGKTLPALCFAALFFLHNLVGGMAWISSEDGDYYRARSTWLLENLGPSDLILTSEKRGYTRYLEYWSESEIVNIYNVDDERFMAAEVDVESWDGDIYILGELFEKPTHACRKNPSFCERLSALSARLEPDVEKVADSSTSLVYRLK